MDDTGAAFLRDIERYCFMVEGLQVPSVDEDIVSITKAAVKRDAEEDEALDYIEQEYETRHFYAKYHYAGTVHLTFKSEKIRGLINKQIANYYDNQLPKAN